MGREAEVLSRTLAVRLMLMALGSAVYIWATQGGRIVEPQGSLSAKGKSNDAEKKSKKISLLP